MVTLSDTTEPSSLWLVVTLSDTTEPVSLCLVVTLSDDTSVAVVGDYSDTSTGVAGVGGHSR